MCIRDRCYPYILNSGNGLVYCQISCRWQNEVYFRSRHRISPVSYPHLLEGRIEEIKLQLKEAAKQRLRQITQKPQEEDLINETFDEIEKDYRDEISKLKTRIKYLAEEAEKKAEICLLYTSRLYVVPERLRL